MSTLSVVVHTCDRYKFLYEGFFYFFDQFFPLKDIPAYLLTEEIDYSHPNVTTIKTGKGEWSERLQIGLSQIKEDYVFYLQEDFWFLEMGDEKTLKLFF